MSGKIPLAPTHQVFEQAMKRSAEIKAEIARERIARALDLAVLSPTATASDVYKACQIVEKEGIASVCVAPSHVAYAKRFAARVCCVIGFPHGNTFPNVKWREAMMAMDRGAIELDVVVNYGQFLAGRATLLRHELKDLVKAAHKRNVPVKAILEVCHYTPEQIRQACELCIQYEVDWVKTSTGFGTGGATPEAVQIMLDACAGRAQVKASGGISTYADAARYLDMGCTRIGSSKFYELLP
jgi:deoxyribose-phosphate aldolase